jgi:hypothetical protein
MENVDGPNADKSERIKLDFSWIQTTQPPNTHESLPSSRMDATSRGVDQVGDILPRD